MTPHSRQVLAVTLVAAALCADRVVVAAPALRVTKTTSTSQRLVERLTTSFRQVVPAAKVIEARQDCANVESRVPAPQPVVVTPQPISPFQFRLPPPAL